jgi:hypothetical protein
MDDSERFRALEQQEFSPQPLPYPLSAAQNPYLNSAFLTNYQHDYIST